MLEYGRQCNTTMVSISNSPCRFVCVPAPIDNCQTQCLGLRAKHVCFYTMHGGCYEWITPFWRRQLHAGRITVPVCMYILPICTAAIALCIPTVSRHCSELGGVRSIVHARKQDMPFSINAAWIYKSRLKVSSVAVPSHRRTHAHEMATGFDFCTCAWYARTHSAVSDDVEYGGRLMTSTHISETWASPRLYTHIWDCDNIICDVAFMAFGSEPGELAMAPNAEWW